VLEVIRADLERVHDPTLVKELLEAYLEAKRGYYLGGLRLSAVEGGRFCEAAFRMLEERTTGGYTPLGAHLDIERVRARLENISCTMQPDSIRIHIPRALRVVYDIRNKRDTAHLADGIDPNLQDATLVVSVLDWVVAEFVRLYYSVPASEAQRIVESLVSRRAPGIQDFDRFLKVLNPRLAAGDHIVLLLYQRGRQGATFSELEKWARPRMRMNRRRTLERLVSEHAYVRFDGIRYYVTESGVRQVERRRLYQVPDS
jgi:hypothetical protein